MLFIDRLAKVADDPIVQGADPVNINGGGQSRGLLESRALHR
jgi:hypothetical protein